MSSILKINYLNYQNFKNISYSFDNRTFYSIVGGSNSGKTTFFRLLSSLILTNNVICCNNIILNKKNRFKYLLNIGIVERVSTHSFIYKSVIDEMKYPLYNLKYSRKEVLEIINNILKFFNVSYFLGKSINELNDIEKQKLLIIISLLHQPKVLLLDNVFDFFPEKEKIEIIKLLKKLVEKGLTIISFTKKLELLSDRIILIDNFEIIGEYTSNKVYEDDKLFYSHNLAIPFITDLSIKLKMYGILDKEYSSMKEMVDDIWP